VKKYMMILGAKIISTNEAEPDKTIMKLELLEMSPVRKTATMSKILKETMGGNLKAIYDNAQEWQNTQLLDVIYCTIGEWKDRGYKIGRHVTVEVLPDDTTGGIK